MGCYRDAYFVYEVRRLETPPIRDLVPFDVYLTCKDLLPDFASGLSYIGPSSVHALVRNHSNGEIVCGHSVVLSAHDFRCHVARSA